RRRVYESGDKGESWTEALGTLSRVWGKKKDKGAKGVRSGFITARIDGVGDNKKVMLVTLPVYAKEAGKKETGNSKGKLHLWLTDNTHIVDIGPVSDDDAAASSLMYKSGEGETNNEELIALYEKKKDGEKTSPGMVSVLLTAQLQRVKDVLATWKKADETVSKLCPSSAEKDESTDNACSPTVKVTDGLVGFLSGNFSGDTWRDEYLGVNATVNNKAGAAEGKKGEVTSTEKGVKFRGAWAEWPVGEQGENQLYHFANYNFTLVATVSIDGVPKGGSHIPLMGAKIRDENKNIVFLVLSYNKEKSWEVLSSGTVTKEQSSTWEPGKTHQVAIVLYNGTQGSAYVDGKLVGSAECELKTAELKEISHFYIGGGERSGDIAGSEEDVSVTVTNVLLYNRPWNSEEIGALNPNKDPITTRVTENAPETMLQSPAKPQPLEEEPLKENIGGSDGVSRAASVSTTPSSDFAQTVGSEVGDTMRGNGSPQTPEVGASSGEDGEMAGGTDGQKREAIHPHNGEVNATAINSSLGNVSQVNNTDAGTMRGSGLLPSLLLLGLWVFA
ncbi:trans-sialidase, partial [Trypanosoma cruzi]